MYAIHMFMPVLMYVWTYMCSHVHMYVYMYVCISVFDKFVIWHCTVLSLGLWDS